MTENQPTPERLAELRIMPYEEYLQTPEWQEKREQALERANHRCQLCNSPESLNVHHRTYEKGRGNEDIADLTVLCNEHHSQFHSIAQKQEKSFQSIAKVMQNLFAQQEESGPLGRIVETGYGDIDYVLGGGLHKSDLVLIGGRPGDGKSALGLNIARNVALKGKSVVIFSLEMHEQLLFDRLVSMSSGVNLREIRSRRSSEENWEKIITSMSDVENLPIHISNDLTTADSMSTQLQRFIDETGKVDLVIVDYIGLIESDKYVNRQFTERLAVRGLKRLARKFDIPVLAFCQLPRTIASRQEKVPQLAHLSNEQDQDADVVMLMYPNDTFNPDTSRINFVDLIIAKNSNGPTGEIALYFKKECVLFSDFVLTPEIRALYEKRKDDDNPF
jgi:replicative DNA helicase